MTKGNVLYEKSGVAPSPSKDFHQVLVTEKEVLWRSWRISLRKDQVKIPPNQRKISYEDFRYDSQTQSDIARIFGKDTVDYIQGVMFQDWLIRMPEKVILKIIYNLELLDVTRVSQTCTMLRGVCASDELWRFIYTTHSGRVTDEVRALAKDMGWRKTFFTNKLQLQKEMSRLRKSASQREKEYLETL